MPELAHSAALTIQTALSIALVAGLVLTVIGFIAHALSYRRNNR